MSSIAFLTRVKASKRTRTANVARRGFLSFCATACNSFEACVRRSDCMDASLCNKEGLKVLVKRSCASSVLKTAKAFETASISS
eukprot:CAMPEP_0169365376 /NCGR_PEP_ID=MMETSP1017-20121227/32521_1 /TAXON_ID=342587 /ORGANISM="Karlodinium micrum, Strain CCMP2283" /LENGTH=83 /DNA_ID=CAMNT_0009463183 /DNA_START=44 /DNA_END=295 /DNA_ORIENTATION=-